MSWIPHIVSGVNTYAHGGIYSKQINQAAVFIAVVLTFSLYLCTTSWLNLKQEHMYSQGGVA